ncbi:MAG TPA: response regulator [Gemmataceae bacterium]
MGAQQTPPPGLNVLIVEDHGEVAEMMAGLLRLDGHAVRVATDGPAGLAAALGDPPDVLLLDIGLPGLDGWEVARRVHTALGAKTPLIIAVTGYDLPADRLRSGAAGVHLHMGKPADPDAIRNLLRSYGVPHS